MQDTAPYCMSFSETYVRSQTKGQYSHSDKLYFCKLY